MAPITNELATSATPAAGPGTLETFVATAKTQANGRAGKPERFSQPVFEITPIREVDLFRVVRKHNKCRWRDVCLRRIKQLEPLSWLAGGGMIGHRLFQHLVQRGCGYPLPPFRDDRQGGVKDLWHALTKLCGDEDEGRIRHE